MGTNYYARIIPKEEDKQELIKAIQEDNFNAVTSLASELYGSRNEYSHKGNEVHLGKSSCGWKFLWNCNIHRFPNGYLDDDKNYILEYDFDYVYPPTKEGIINFVMREDVYVIDGHGKVQDKTEFLNYAFNKEGIDGKEYYTNPKYDSGTYWGEDKETLAKYKELGFTPEYGEFYSDGLRFATSIDFC